MVSYNQPETIYPPIPKPAPSHLKGLSRSQGKQKKSHYLFKLDKKGLKYAVS